MQPHITRLTPDLGFYLEEFIAGVLFGAACVCWVLITVGLS